MTHKRAGSKDIPSLKHEDKRVDIPTVLRDQVSRGLGGMK